MKWKDIVANAEKVKENVEKNHKLPTIKGYNAATLCYIFGEAVRKPGKDVVDKTVKNCPSCTGSSISKNLTRNEYVKLATNTNKYIVNHKNTAPNFTSYQNYKVSIRLQVYCYAKIIVWYDNHKNTLPTTCWFKNEVFSNVKTTTSSTTKKTTNTSTSVIKKYGRSTKSSCDNRGQNTGYYCGPHMAQEIVRNLCGVVVPQSKIAGIMGTTTSGTGHYGIETFFAWFNKNYTKYNLTLTWKNFSDLGWSGVKKILESTNQDCGIHEKYRDTWGHYTNFDKVYENSVDVHNSLGSMCTSSCYCGYEENRSKANAKSYVNGISQKSVLVITRTK